MKISQYMLPGYLRKKDLKDSRILYDWNRRSYDFPYKILTDTTKDTTLPFQKKRDDGVFPKCRRIFIEFTEFSEFRKSDKSLKHELGSI